MLLPDGGRGYLSKIFNDQWMASTGSCAPLDGDQRPTVGDVLRGKSGELPDLVHTHPSETLRDAIEILREYGVSQMPVVGAEPPVMAGEVAGAVIRARSADAVFAGRAHLADPSAQHMGEPFPLIGSGEPVGCHARRSESPTRSMVVDDGKPVGVITRHDLLAYLAISH